MPDTIQGIRSWQTDEELDGGAPIGGPPDDPASAMRAARAAADARFQAFVSTPAANDPCLDFAAPDHDFDRCVQSSVANAVLFQKQTADTDAVDSRDVRQDGLGDCYLLAPLAALASTPQGRASIRGAISENKNDQGEVVSWTVKLHQPQSHLFGATTFREVHVTVDGPYVIGHARLRPENGQNEVWPLVIEKAYAQYAGGYNNIGRGGVPADAMEVLTGREAKYVSLGFLSRLPPRYGPADLRADLAHGKIVVLSTKPDITSSADAGAVPRDVQENIDTHQLRGSHAYFVQGVEQHDGKPFLRLGNPWGEDQPDLVPWDELRKWFSDLSIGSVP